MELAGGTRCGKGGQYDTNLPKEKMQD